MTCEWLRSETSPGVHSVKGGKIPFAAKRKGLTLWGKGADYGHLQEVAENPTAWLAHWRDTEMFTVSSPCARARECREGPMLPSKGGLHVKQPHQDPQEQPPAWSRPGGRELAL